LIALNDLIYPRHIPIALQQAGLAWFTSAADQARALRETQQPLLDALLEQLPPSAKILVIGSGSSNLLQLLAAKGYKVSDLASEAHGVSDESRNEPGQPFLCQRLLNLTLNAGHWDLLLFLESSREMEALDLFEKASALLKPQGHILFMDEFSGRRTEIAPDPLHHKGYFLALAERFGFNCVAEQDYTDTAKQTLNVLLDVWHKAVDQLSSTEKNAQNLLASLQEKADIAQKFSQGRCGYFLLHLMREKVPDWRLSRLQAVDQPAVSRLFKRVFNAELSPALWNWKYGPGQGLAIGLWQKDELIAHYGAIPRRLKIGANRLLASQSCDVMVVPEMRGLMLRHGPFYLVCVTFIEQYLGNGTPHPLGFGFPNERAYRLPHKLGLYGEPTTRIHEFNWSAVPARRRCSLRRCNPHAAGDGASLDRLWQAMAGDLQDLAVGVRDAAYWRRRYADHPEHSYHLYFVVQPILRRPLAAFAVRKEGEQLKLMDWVCRVADLPRVILSARSLAAQMSLSSLSLLASLPIAPFLAQTEAQEVDPNIVVPQNGRSDSQVELIQDKLWLTGGDTDFL